MMSKHLSGFALFAIFLSLPTIRAHDNKVTMSGFVTDSRSHQPVEGAKVTVVGNAANAEITDRDGNFILTFSASTREGDVVRVRVEKSGYKVYEVNKPVSSTLPVQFQIDRIAPTTPHSSSKPSPTQIDEVNDLDRFFVRHSEGELEIQFGFGAMMERNILMVKDRIMAFRKTGDRYNFDITPYQFDGGQMLLETNELRANRINEGAVGVGPLPADRVFLIMLPKEYVQGRIKLSEYEKSPELPTEVVAAVKEFDVEVERNAQTLRSVLDTALQENPDNFLFHDDPGSSYWRRIDGLYREKFVPLSPKANAVGAAIRRFLGVT